MHTASTTCWVWRQRRTSSRRGPGLRYSSDSGTASVERVEILWEETLALEGRAAHYDGVGALRDVLQSHMLQLLLLVGMEPPWDIDLHRQKLDVLKTIRVLGSRRARYTAGTPR